MMKHSHHKTPGEAASPWVEFLVRNFLESNSSELSERKKDAQLANLAEQLKAVKKLEDWTPRTMGSVVAKSDYHRVADLRGLSGDATCLRVLPGGEIVVGGSCGGLVAWSETSPGRWQAAELSDCEVGISQVELLPDRRVIASDETSTIRVYKKDNDIDWQCQAEFLAPDFLTSFDVTPDGRLFAVGTDGYLHWVRESSVGNWQATILGNLEEDIATARATPDGGVVLVGETSRVFWLSRDTSGEWSRSLSLQDGLDLSGFRSVQVISAGLILVGAPDFSLVVKVANRNDENDWLSHVLCNHVGPITCLSAFSDETIVSGSADHTVVVWMKSAEGYTDERLVGHEGPVTCVQLLPDGRVASGSKDGTVRLWSREREGQWSSEVLNTLSWGETLGKRIGILQHQSSVGAVTHLQVLPNGRIVVAGSGGRVQVWDGEAVE